MAQAMTYRTTGSPRLKGYYERRSVVDPKNLTVSGPIILLAGETTPKKNPPEARPPADGRRRVAKAYAFMFAFTASAVIGSERTRAPHALKIALASAGATTVTAGSPTPVACSPLAMTLMATSGI
jgi:hypothetical protein